LEDKKNHIEINFFVNEENCKEFKILKKSTSKLETILDLKKGQELLKSIYRNCLAINSKLNEIDNSFVKREVINSWDLNIVDTFGLDKRLIKDDLFNIKYESKLEERLVLHNEDQRIYDNSIEICFRRVFYFLDYNFDHEIYEKEVEDLKKKIGKGKSHFQDRNDLSFKMIPIEDNIKTLLEHHDRISNRLANYMLFFFKNR
jgi:hypothetical protein